MMRDRYYAHSGLNPDRSDWQLLPDHHKGVAELAAERGSRVGLRAAAALAGGLHDFGKYDPAFDRVLLGENLRVDHSTAGGWLALNRAKPQEIFAAEALAYTILGHHAGLPDKEKSASCLSRRVAAFSDSNPLPPALIAAQTLDLEVALSELILKCPGPRPDFNLSVAVRMLFSCLVDADFRDTEAFYSALKGHEKPRDWAALPDILGDLTACFDRHMANFREETELNQRRRHILASIRGKATMSPGLFTLTVPTGGGKTLASMGFALDHAKAHGHRRIIYAIPYSSITQQTAKTFGGLFGDVVLEHHSTVDEEKSEHDLYGDETSGRGQREKRHLAMEDWAAPIVVTTNVQLFESLFSARGSRTRKLHNIAGSVIILDEAQCLPRRLLLPTLRMIETLCTHYGCSIVLCTATQPAFDSRQLKAGGLMLDGRELAPEPDRLAQELRRARIVRGGEMSDEALVAALAATPQGFIIVNSRAHALELFNSARKAGLEDLFHLTTRQYPAHRRALIEEIRQRLKAGRPCRLVATSLIEAGVDLDFPVGWRAEAGLDSCIQAAGRVNREGKKKPFENSVLTVFSAPDRPMPAEIRALAEAMRSTATRHDDLMSPAAMRDWFEHVYWQTGPKLLDAENIMGQLVAGRNGTDFAFRTIADAYRMIDTTMISVVIPGDDTARREIARLGAEAVPSGTLARALQNYIVQIPATAREALRANDKGDFAAPHLRGEQFFVLKEESLYLRDSGLWWEGADYLENSIW